LADFQPIVEPLPPQVDVPYAMRRLSSLPHLAVLDSALTMPRLGRYSFLVADPFEVIRISRPTADPLASLARRVERLEQTPRVGSNVLPPFQGGAVGYFSYEFGRCFEKFPAARHDEFEIPLAMFGLYDVVLAWDNLNATGYLISQGLPESDPLARQRRAHQRLRQFRELLEGPELPLSAPAVSFQAMAHGLTAPQYETRLGGGWLGNFDSLGFRQAIDRAREYIYAGDIFQVNLSQRLMRPAGMASIALYRRLREVNPAPFAGYWDGGPFQIISASPERFLQVRERLIETRPIKGTRRRTGNRQHDDEQRQQLLTSTKDRAENTMILDLLRNDLSRICEADSIRVPQWYAIEEYPFVTHAVSVVQGHLRPNASMTDLVRATFPGGSITGAPKVRAMEIIAELEPTVRGPYCGSLGYIGLDGTIDFNILIRTITASRGWWQLQVGGGIVADSRSDAEEEETWVKAAGMVAAIDAADPG
jgi:para-aminobenzoate synthetase component 1